MEKRNNSVIIAVIITVLVMIILGLVAFIVLDKSSNKENKPNIEENKKDNEEQKENYDYAKITEEVNRLSFFITMTAYAKNGEDILSKPEYRLLLTNFNVSDKKIYNNGVYQEFAYASYVDYKNTYLTFYGNNYDLEQDLQQVSPSPYADANNSFLGSGYISWNNTFGAISSIYNLTVEEKKFDAKNDEYILSGKYVDVDRYDETIVGTGTFKIIYNKVDNTNHLKSIIITQD